MADKPEIPLRIEDYALIGDCQSAALVGRNGSIDWLCWPRFDSDACFAALLGKNDNGRWSIAPADPEARIHRAYRDDTMVLETIFETAEGTVAIIDFMPLGLPPDGAISSIVRIVEGRRGKVAMKLHLTLRFDYGVAIPWVTQLEDDGGISAVLGPHRVTLRTTAALRGEALSTVAEFVVGEGESVPFVLDFTRSHRPMAKPIDARRAEKATERYWRDWSGRCTYRGPWREPIVRSLMTLKTLTYAPTGGIVAAPTTSLPEQFGGMRNWDYRFCWLRDATLTLLALMQGGYYDEAQSWRDWLHRAVAGSPEQLQIMYGVGGERRLTEYEIPWLDGFGGAKPVRIGNAASAQLQLDVYGEVMDALHHAREGGLVAAPVAWEFQLKLMEHLEKIWREPDEGIWEIRGPRRHFTFSKVMAWVAFDRAVQDSEKYGLEAPLARWHKIRDEIHETICREGFDSEQQAFTQSFGDRELDASLLMMPMVGFISSDDPKMRGTVAAIERNLIFDGFVARYRTESTIDGLPPGEGAFLPCSFWLADNYILQGRTEEAEALFERLLALRNDVGLLSEEYDPRARRLAGNFPQAFSHMALIGTAFNLHEIGPAQQRPDGAKPTSKGDV
jgi:GH15 family glucan-1,4-alpha-glucosidase